MRVYMPTENNVITRLYELTHNSPGDSNSSWHRLKQH